MLKISLEHFVKISSIKNNLRHTVGINCSRKFYVRYRIQRTRQTKICILKIFLSLQMSFEFKYFRYRDIILSLKKQPQSKGMKFKKHIKGINQLWTWISKTKRLKPTPRGTFKTTTHSTQQIQLFHCKLYWYYESSPRKDR